MTVAIIGAIGGTMGLCIGFSFMEVSSCLLGLLEMAFKKIKFQPTQYMEPVIVSVKGPRPKEWTETGGRVDTQLSEKEQISLELKHLRAKVEKLETILAH